MKLVKQYNIQSLRTFNCEIPKQETRKLKKSCNKLLMRTKDPNISCPLK